MVGVFQKNIILPFNFAKFHKTAFKKIHMNGKLLRIITMAVTVDTDILKWPLLEK